MAELAHYVTEVELVLRAGEIPLTAGPGAQPTLTGPNGYPLVQSSDLVPGDVVVVGAGKMAYDGILLAGETVMDETVLTGVCERVCVCLYPAHVIHSLSHAHVKHHRAELHLQAMCACVCLCVCKISRRRVHSRA